eukprot:5946404-Pleurochrysis_carterae.AAC.1
MPCSRRIQLLTRKTRCNIASCRIVKGDSHMLHAVPATLAKLLPLYSHEERSTCFSFEIISLEAGSGGPCIQKPRV